MDLEAAVLIGQNDEILYEHVPRERTGGCLPDSSLLWEKIWELRHGLKGVAHSHPGSGWPLPSRTDEITFFTVTRALFPLDWYICSHDRCIRINVLYEGQALQVENCPNPSWLPRLRELSYHLEVQNAGQ